jgi:tetratricopeptide (TPR) repeat protein
MRRFILWVIFIFCAAGWMYGAAVLKGRITLQNSGGIPVANAQVSAVGSNSVISTDPGFFELAFPGKAPGDLVFLTVQKPGFEVVNEKDLKRVILRKNPEELLEISMCPAGKWQENAQLYYGIAAKSINDVFDERLKKIEAAVMAIAEKEREIQKLREERDAALAQAKKMAEEFAQVNLDEASGLYKEAFACFQQGDIDKALELLNDARLEQGLNNTIAVESKAKQRLEEIGKARKQWAENYILKARLSMIKLRFEEAERNFEKSLEADPGEPGNYSEFIKFLSKQNKFEKGRKICNRALLLEIDDAGKSEFLNNLGLIYCDTGSFAEAEKSCTEALDIRRKLANTNPATYLSDVAKTLNSMGKLYLDTNRFSDAEKSYKEALDIRRKLANTNPAAYLSDVAMTLNSLGILYKDTTRFSDAEKSYTEALDIRRKLAETNPAAYLSDVAKTLNNLGNLYSDTNRFSDAEKSYKESLDIRRKLAETNPAAYLPSVAATLNNLGILYKDTTRFSDAEKSFTEALDKYRKLAETNPAAYLPDLAMTLNNLGTLYSDTTRLSEAEKSYTEALDKYRKLAGTNPAAYLPYVATTLNNLGTLYSDTTRLSDAEKSYTEALEKYRKLAETNLAAYLPYVAKTLNNLGLLEISNKNYINACAHLNEALKIREKLALESPSAFDLDLCQTILTMISLYASAPGNSISSESDIPALLLRADEILKKYPEVPQAQKLLKMVEQFKKDLEKNSSNKNSK